MKQKYTGYDESTITTLQNDKHAIFSYGTEILAKRIPVDARLGMMDPR
ncbi:MAG: hypothetical protein HGA22_13005 [Clostridiales bacterium]|nr:hypothetical protein [Clostridiales bacterium]